MIVRVYRNLRTGTLSVQTKTPKGWRVTSHPSSISLTDVKFTVREAGRQRVLREKRKNVHAWLEGSVKSVDKHIGPPLWRRAYYNPYRYTCWVTTFCTPIGKAELATVYSDGSVYWK